jgi:hypothetical protein
MGIGLGVILALNALVDPLGAYRSFSLSQFEPYRAQLATRPAKAELIARGNCDTLLLGSSRVLVGLPVSHPAYNTPQVYNLALSGTMLTETSDVLDFSLRHNRLKRVLLGTDFHMFSDAREVKSSFETSRFNPQLDLLEYHCRNLFGSQALDESWRLFWQRLRGRSPPPGEHGWVPKSVPRNLSQRELFTQRIRASLTNPGSDAGYRRSPERFEQFRQMIQRCRRENVELILFIPPVHALQLEAVHAAGLWSEFEQWKKDLVRIVAEEGGADAIPIWDFTGFKGRVAEPIPAEGDRITRMKWYLEISHFTPALGQVVVERMLGQPENARGNPDDFGVRLNAANIESHLARIRADREAYAVAHPEEIALVAQLAVATKGKKEANVTEF